MQTIELSLEYWNKLAEHTISICALLGGFSIAVIVSLLNTKNTSRVFNNIFRAAIVAATSFLVAVFAMTKILLMTSPGFPFEVSNAALAFPRVLGSMALFFGVISLMVIISLSGWTKSKGMGVFTSILGLTGLIFILLMLT